MPRPKGSQNKDKTKKKRDKDAPKKGKSAFFYYLDQKKEEARRNNPHAKHPEIISLLSKQWNKLSPIEKQPYELLAAKDRERFHREKEVFQAKLKAKEEAEEAEIKSGKRKVSGARNLDEPKAVKKIKEVRLIRSKEE